MNRISSLLLRFLFRYRYFRQVLWAGGVVCVAGIFWLVLLRTGALVSLPAGWERGFTVTPAEYAVRDYAVSVNRSFAAVAAESGFGGKTGIFCSISTDGSQSFLPFSPVVYFPPAKSETPPRRNPHIAVSGNGIISAAWQDFSESDSLYSIYISSSRDFGGEWSVPARLQLGTKMDFLPRIYYDDRNRLHLFYCAPQGAGFNLYHAISADGAVFEESSPVARLSSDMKGAFFPSVVFDGENVYIVWQGRGIEKDRLTDDLYFSSSSDYGSGWSRPKRITASSAFDS
ncbi:MAG: hypothetical protein ACRCUT_02190, partial [Spirochaetota bacterium]